MKTKYRIIDIRKHPKMLRKTRQALAHAFGPGKDIDYPFEIQDHSCGKWLTIPGGYYASEIAAVYALNQIPPDNLLPDLTSTPQ